MCFKTFTIKQSTGKVFKSMHSLPILKRKKVSNQNTQASIISPHRKAKLKWRKKKNLMESLQWKLWQTLNYSVINSTAIITYAYIARHKFTHPSFQSVVKKNRKSWYLKLILATDEPKQKIKTINTSYSQNTLKQCLCIWKEDWH